MEFNCNICGGPMRPLLTHYFCPKDCDRPASPVVSSGKSTRYGLGYDTVLHPVTRRRWDVYIVDAPIAYGALLWSVDHTPQTPALLDMYKKAVHFSYIDDQSTGYERDWCMGSTLYDNGVSQSTIDNCESSGIHIIRFVPTAKEDIDKYPKAIQ